MKVLENLKYTSDHEWIRIDGDVAYIGITDFAQSELGDIVFVEVNTVGETLSKEEVLGTIEAVKTVSDVFMPISGEILELNPEIESDPSVINKDPYNNGWIVKVKIQDASELNNLLSAAQYKEVIGA